MKPFSNIEKAFGNYAGWPRLKVDVDPDDYTFEASLVCAGEIIQTSGEGFNSIQAALNELDTRLEKNES